MAAGGEYPSQLMYLYPDQHTFRVMEKSLYFQNYSELIYYVDKTNSDAAKEYVPRIGSLI